MIPNESFSKTNNHPIKNVLSYCYKGIFKRSEKESKYLAMLKSIIKPLTFLCLLLFCANVLQAQKKGEVIIGFNTGASLSNLLKSEAPHKVNLFGSDVEPVFVYSQDLTEILEYVDYETGIYNDLLFGFSTGIHLEYFINNNLSFQSGISLESKGINLDYSNLKMDFSTNVTLKEAYKIELRNDYLIVPLQLRRYILKGKNIFVSGGLYVGYLVSSRIDYLIQKTVFDSTGESVILSRKIDKVKDEKRAFTNKFDYGISLGTGFVKKISDKLHFKSEMLFNMGLRKLDSKYNNELLVRSYPLGSNFFNFGVRSTNYFGLNSNSRNINMLITFGLAYTIRK